MIYIVIPVFNRKQFTKDCLLSLRKQSFHNFKIIVVDDGSTDGTGEMLDTEFPEVIVLKGDGNLFWTAGTNMGIEYALKQSDVTHVMTLNNDTIATDTFMEQMDHWAKEKGEALLGAFALDSDSKKPVYGGANMNWRRNGYESLLEKVPENKQHGLHEVNHFPGRGLLIPKAVFEKIGLFDQKVFPHYYADYDFTHMAVRAGFKIYCNYDAKLYIYPDESGDRANRKKKSAKKYYDHLFGIRGGGNLPNFTRYVLRNCPKYHIPYVLLNGYVRRIFGYLLK